MDDDTDANKILTLVKADDAAPGDADGPDIEAFWPGFSNAGAAGALAAQELPRLVVAMGKEGFKPGATAFYTLQYFHMGLGEFGYDDDGQWFRFPFHQPKGGKLLLARGRNIMGCANAISLHRLPWIRMADRDLRPAGGGSDDTPIFTKIEVTEVED
jgi:hypothetical protein